MLWFCYACLGEFGYENLGGGFQLKKKIMIQKTELEMRMQFRLPKNCLAVTLHPLVPG